MFETLSDRFNSTFRSLSGRGKITESNIQDAMREVRTALIEADVHLDVVRDFVKEITDESIGREVTKSLKPGQEIIGIVNQKLVDLMGPVEPGIMMVEPGPTVVMMCGLQGSGKTTTCGKLAAWLKRQGRGVMVAAADLQRPAAVEQLQTVTEDVSINATGAGRVLFYGEPDKCDEYGKATGVAVGVCQRAFNEARKQKVDVLILDTAGRLHINDELMSELQSINRSLNPHQIFLVVDAMVGQDAVNSAKEFHQRLAIDGVILTKFDSDTRGGAALSVKKVTGAPIKFIGTGEGMTALEPFHPERMASRILGMGDVVSLVEKAQQEVTEEEAEKIAEKMAKGRMTMDDFLKQLRSIRRMGPMKQLMGMLPGVGSALKDVEVDEKQLDHLEAIVQSMTEVEREKVDVINKSRTRRIARGSGTSNQEVNRLLKQFETMQKVSKQMGSMGMLGKAKAMKEVAAMGSDMPGLSGLPGLSSKGSTKTTSVKQRGFKRRKKRK